MPKNIPNIEKVHPEIKSRYRNVRISDLKDWDTQNGRNVFLNNLRVGRANSDFSVLVYDDSSKLGLIIEPEPYSTRTKNHTDSIYKTKVGDKVSAAGEFVVNEKQFYGTLRALYFLNYTLSRSTI